MDIIDLATAIQTVLDGRNAKWLIVGAMGVIAIVGTYYINKLTNLLDSYRHKYGFDRTLESKLYKNDKDLNRAEQHFQKRVSK